MHADGGLYLPGYFRRRLKLGPALYAQSPAVMDGVWLPKPGEGTGRSSQAQEGIDPNEARRAERPRQRLDASEKHAYQWLATLSTYSYDYWRFTRLGSGHGRRAQGP